MSCLTIQANLNHAGRAQDLFLQSLAERDGGLGIISEPYRVPVDNPNWVSSTDGRAAIVWRGAEKSPPMTLLEAGVGHVAVRWGTIVVVSLYVSPNMGSREYNERMLAIRDCVRKHTPLPIIIAGDFNAKSGVWGSPRTNEKGRTVLDWAAELGLTIMNTGNISTCVRMQGESIIDLTWATPSAVNKISGWRVAVEAETLSDHRYIEFFVSAADPTVMKRRRAQDWTRRRWSLKKLDEDVFGAMLQAHQLIRGEDGQRDVQGQVQWMTDTIENACRASMPKTKFRPAKCAYWWSDTIAELRQETNRARRLLRRRRRGEDPDEDKWRGYRLARDELRAAIRNAKARSWDELLLSLNEDPWGRPYKMVLNKLKRGASPLTESMDPHLVRNIVDALFPRANRGGGDPIPPKDFE